MTPPLWIHALEVLGNTVHMIVAGAYILRLLMRSWYGSAPQIINTVFFELRPFYLPAIFTTSLIALATGEWNWGHPITLAFSLVNWWLWRNEKDDDDRWKRRREKLAEKVEAVGGKLTVVPVGSPA